MAISIPKLDGNSEDVSGAEPFDIIYSPIGTNEHRLADKEIAGEEEEMDEF